jgi:hypothetical protein
LIVESDVATLVISNTRPPIVPTAEPVSLMPPTNAEVTAPSGKRRRRRQRHQKKVPIQPPSPPPALATRRSKRKRKPKQWAAHAKQGRRNKPSKHRSALTKQPIMTNTPIILSMTHDDLLTYQCMHGTAINSDTGNVAEYKELRNSADGLLWAAANMEEIGRMCQRLGPDSDMPTGTDSLRSIHKG